MDSASRAPSDLDAGRLQQINRLATIARLVAGLAHELNNSLQVVSGLVELLGDRTDLPADVLTRIQKIGGQADKATGAVRNVLGFSREIAPARSTLDVGAIVTQAVALRRYYLGRAGITVHVDAPPAPLRATGDERELTQLVLNLLLNAEEALANQPTREVRVRVAGDGGRAQIVVSDTGHGVAADVVDRIFEPFFTTRDNARALGLGLTVVRDIVTRHGGRVTLADATPGMTTFVVELPAM